MRKNKKSFPSPTPILLGWTYNWNIIFHCLGSSVASSHNWALYQAVTQMTQAIALCPCDWTPAVFTFHLFPFSWRLSSWSLPIVHFPSVHSWFLHYFACLMCLSIWYSNYLRETWILLCSDSRRLPLPGRVLRAQAAFGSGDDKESIVLYKEWPHVWQEYHALLL